MSGRKEQRSKQLPANVALSNVLYVMFRVDFTQQRGMVEQVLYSGVERIAAFLAG